MEWPKSLIHGFPQCSDWLSSNNLAAFKSNWGILERKTWWHRPQESEETDRYTLMFWLKADVMIWTYALIQSGCPHSTGSWGWSMDSISSFISSKSAGLTTFGATMTSVEADGSTGLPKAVWLMNGISRKASRCFMFLLVMKIFKFQVQASVLYNSSKLWKSWMMCGWVDYAIFSYQR